ncbi:hypothetical protein BGZ49_010623 [Haplosporangium sp. Z 27]|nr:hypothetical protein BGZ49_010623 [Haplosporangium sp. Z 27]
MNYRNTSQFAPREICSSASSARQNENRNLEIRQACGSKVDGLITCKKSNCEIGAIEVGDIDEGSTGTKALKDSRKLAKLLKDMFEAICNNCKSETNIRSELRVSLLSSQEGENYGGFPQDGMRMHTKAPPNR